MCIRGTQPCKICSGCYIGIKFVLRYWLWTTFPTDYSYIFLTMTLLREGILIKVWRPWVAVCLLSRIARLLGSWHIHIKGSQILQYRITPSPNPNINTNMRSPYCVMRFIVGYTLYICSMTWPFPPPILMSPVTLSRVNSCGLILSHTWHLYPYILCG